MAEMHTYTHLDIERYLQHKMTPQEMHNFERSLMDDPFLADALEGYRQSAPALSQQHLAEIEEQLRGEKHSTRVVPLHPHKSNLLRIAAIVVVIALAGLLTYQVVKNKDTGSSLAAKDVQMETADTTTTKLSLAEVDSQPSESTPIKPVQALKVAPAGQAKPALTSATPPSLAMNDEAEKSVTQRSFSAEAATVSAQDSSVSPLASAQAKAKADAPAMASRQASAVPPANVARSLGYARAAYTFSGRVVNQAGEPIPYANLTIDGSNQAVTTNNKGEFNLAAADSTVQVSVADVGYTSTTVTLSGTTPQIIQLENNNQSLAEVVVSNMLKKNNFFTKTDTSLAVPDGGWKKFEKYLTGKIEGLKEANDDFNGDVVLSFSIDDKGRPINISVLSQFNKVAAGQAVDFLKEGPKWTKKIDKKVKVTVPF